MEIIKLRVHSVYGVIYREGEFVQRGAVLGLSTDSQSVVLAPVSGWVKWVENTKREHKHRFEGLNIEIWESDSRGIGNEVRGKYQPKLPELAL